MRSKTKLFLMLIIAAGLVLGACKVEGGISAEDLEELADPDLEEVDQGKIDAARSEEGEALVKYNYQMKMDELKFNIETDIPLTFNKDSAGHWTANGIGETEVTLYMLALGTEAGTCDVICHLVLRMVAEGTVAPISETDCQIPISFQFVAQDDWIMEGSCPDKEAAGIDCAAFSVLMTDPGIYTFTPQKTIVTLQDSGQVTQLAALKVVNMPAELEDTCGW